MPPVQHPIRLRHVSSSSSRKPTRDTTCTSRVCISIASPRLGSRSLADRDVSADLRRRRAFPRDVRSRGNAVRAPHFSPLRHVVQETLRVPETPHVPRKRRARSARSTPHTFPRTRGDAARSRGPAETPQQRRTSPPKAPKTPKTPRAPPQPSASSASSAPSADRSLRRSGSTPIRSPSTLVDRSLLRSRGNAGRAPHARRPTGSRGLRGTQAALSLAARQLDLTRILLPRKHGHLRRQALCPEPARHWKWPTRAAARKGRTAPQRTGSSPPRQRPLQARLVLKLPSVLGGGRPIGGRPSRLRRPRSPARDRSSRPTGRAATSRRAGGSPSAPGARACGRRP